ncbi:hypothetical protein SADUNF_Sadunf10G0148500 [Salix dunnii]|uniref:SNARE-complex protein Syntaxin-18 N-terminal domain-containing protein n=1 Tax=Salix dunnii TaxID=1413687 RepID=A0A835MV67_9ROSI|nr:hypothetical protein SADUNF_Sadunf10G0148500 [Salix dunnii]
MAKIRDRTEDFKDASKLAAIMASFIIHKPRQRSPFTKAALKTLESIGALEQFMLKHRKDYVDLHRTTEQERDSIEQEVTAFIKACKEQIDILKDSINDEETNTKGWLGIKADTANTDTIAHKHGVVLILSEKLHSITSRFDQLRAIRFQDAINKRTPRRKLNRNANKNTSLIDSSRTNNLEFKEPDEIQPEPLSVQQQFLDDETRALQVELTSLLDAVQETETKMVEMSALNHLMSTHVLQQAQQIELLYEQVGMSSYNIYISSNVLISFLGETGIAELLIVHVDFCKYSFPCRFDELVSTWCQPFLFARELRLTRLKMVKGRQGERVRLYVRGTILGYKRSKSNQYPNTSLVQVEGVNTKEEVAWYAGKRMAYIYKAKVKQNGSHYRCIWGKVTRPHGNSGVVRAKFKSNLPPKSMVWSSSAGFHVSQQYLRYSLLYIVIIGG